MFTALAIVLIVAIGWYVERANVHERSIVATLSDNEVRTAILHGRQELKLVAFLLGGILIMLGLIADRIH
jgi:hypothetical protein